MAIKTLIAGAGQNGSQVYNILKLDPRIEVVAFLDDDPDKKGSEKYGLPVAGTVAQAAALAQKMGATGAIAALGNNYLRAKINQQLAEAGLGIVSAIHPHTFIDDTVSMGEGAIVEMGVMIHPHARLGRDVFVGGSTVIAHDCIIGDHVLLGGGVVFGGDVRVGDYSTLGVGSILQPHLRIGCNVITGIGAVVVKDLSDNSVAVGVPAKVIRRQDPPPAL